eukprot:CAMPEP_0175046266 /NCGR_PEP_ID=MMETSP0052_2-20121109/4931_1 /TAXON_ID=51329 ORGANISM="Polytomella parva, Strain SAG 63-3" /NCGR_SAMPLE_ID=MMETSP0052_2 /ASSEMBLY_ACC=CAM_ASM_000194 /LENGTH=1056 /DNA_ID=CAMNT_0016309985 /DNA_START=63 /DNA_END=3230 /DNA_ORIENTATION=+
MSGMDDDIYDEFGNYIGPDLDGSEDEDNARPLNDNEPYGYKNASAEDDDEAEGRYGHAMNGYEEDEEADDDNDSAPGSSSTAVVLHEDKKYYPTAEEVYGADVEALVMEEDAQPLEQPIVAPLKQKKIESTLETADAPPTRYSPEFLSTLMANPELIRNVAVVGHLHHGKTTVMDMFVEQTHELAYEWRRNEKQIRFTDTRVDEQERGISVKMSPMSLVMSGTSGKHFLVNLLDCPGHVNFNDEVTAAMRLADGVLLCVDACEGVMVATERAARQAVQEGLRVTLLLTKIDRLITELKLPPADAYHKLRHTIEELNAVLLLAATAGEGEGKEEGKRENSNVQILDPVKGNVAFSSAISGWSFTLESFALLYRDVYASAGVAAADFDHRQFTRRLWGDVYFQPQTRTFRRTAPPGGGARSFVQFILEPLYKVYSQVVGESPLDLQRALATIGVHLRHGALGLDTKPLLKETCTTVFGGAAGVVDMLVRHVPSSRAATADKVRRHYTGPLNRGRRDEDKKEVDNEGGGGGGGGGVDDADVDSSSQHHYHHALPTTADFMLNCNPRGPLIVHVAKLFPKADCSRFDALGRIVSGTARIGDSVRVLGEGFTPEDEEDMSVASITALWVGQSRYRVPISRAGAGNLVLVEGVDTTIVRTATLVAEGYGNGNGYGNNDDDDNDDDSDPVHTFAPLHFQTQAVVKLAIEPHNPSELPKVVDGLRKLAKSYPLASTRVEESGEHTLLGTGELFLDCALRDLRELYSEVEVKVSDPVVQFCETAVDQSSLKCFAETPNGRNKLTMIAEPLDKGLAEEIERGEARLDMGRRQLASYMERRHGWDVLSSRGLWAFGPDRQGPNCLLDDSLVAETDKSLLAAVKDSIIQGFQWGTREGPLCDEPIRNVKFKLLEALIDPVPLHRGGGQMIPTARRVCYSAFLMANPRLMEPVYYSEIQTPADCIAAVYQVLARRRGHVTADVAKPGTPIFTVKAFLPVIESFGFESDLRCHTQGQTFCQSVFDHWQVVPGDPLDRNVVLRPLEPAPTSALAREFMVKTRRRKGMSDDV